LNENGINILIEDIGVDEFVDYVLDLDEARRSGRIEPTTKSGKDVGSLKGGAKTAAIKRLRGEKEKRREAEASSSKSSGMTAALKSQSEKSKVSSGLKKAKTEKSIEKAKSSQAPASNKSSEGTKKEVKKGIIGHLKQSWQTAREVGKEHEKRVARAAGTAAGAAVGAAKAVHRAGQEFGKSESGQKVKAGIAKTAKATVAAAGAGIGSKVAGKSNAAAAGRAAGTFIKKMREDYDLWINELISEGYDVNEYAEEYLIDTYLPEDLDEGIGSALKGLLTPKPSERQQLAKQRMDAHRSAMASGKSGDSPYTPQRKKPSTSITKPNTSERDPWSGNAETDKAWAKGGSAASSPKAYRREDFEEWMEALLEEIELDENTIFLVFESNFMVEEMLFEAKNKEGKEQGADGKACWKGYKYAGTENGKDKCVKSEEVDLEEKAPPGAKFERMVKHIKKGYAKKGGLSDKEKSIAYATAWKAKNEEVDPVAKKQAELKKKLVNKKTQTQNLELNLVKQGKLPLDTSSYEMDGDSIEELNRYERETGKDLKTGKPTSKGGKYGGDDTDSKVMRHMHKVMGAGRMGAGGAIQPRGEKKEKGKKPPKAGEYGGPISPAQKVAKRRAAAQRAQDSMSSRFD
jgi:hypothetical protein